MSGSLDSGHCTLQQTGTRLCSRVMSCRAARGTGALAQAADFFFAFGLTGFTVGGGSGLPSIDDRRPAVKV